MVGNMKTPQLVTSVKVKLKLFTGKENSMFWQKRMKFIEHHLTDDMLCNSMEDIVKQTWEKIEEMFASKSLSNNVFLKDELHSLKIEKGLNMMQHLSAFNRRIADLQRLDEVYKSEDKTVMLLTPVPSFYKHFCTTLMFGKRTLKCEEVMQDILTHHRMKGSKISLGDKTSCDVLGVGIMKIKMQNGVVRSLSEVEVVVFWLTIDAR
ncbi:unnamed protein product [Prunus brigantina]